MRLSIFAYHVTVIMGTEKGCFQLSPFEGLSVHFCLGLNGQVNINGVCAGNRNGAVQEYTRLICEAKPEVIFS